MYKNIASKKKSIVVQLNQFNKNQWMSEFHVHKLYLDKVVFKSSKSKVNQTSISFKEVHWGEKKKTYHPSIPNQCY